MARKILQGFGKKHDCNDGTHYGADSGIGRAVAIACAREGANVAFVYLEEDEDAAETVEWIEKGWS